MSNGNPRPWQQPGAIGWIIALIVLILVVVAYLFGGKVTEGLLLGFIGLLAIARLL